MNLTPLACLLLVPLVWSTRLSAAPTPQDPYRQAVLIGVWNYTHAPGSGLGEMTSDLTALARTFHRMQFDAVVTLPNPTKTEIEDALIAAARAASAADKGRRATLTVVYFGGHGTMFANASYLLGKDYLPPADASDLVLRGGIRADYVGEIFSTRGQPSLLIVEACRNPFTPDPNAPDPDVIDVTPSGPYEETIMISGPDRFSGYAAFFGQAPGQIVQIKRTHPDQPTSLVSAFEKATLLTGSAGPLLAAVRDKVVSETAGQAHPQRPEYLDRGGGDLRLYYEDSDRDADRAKWEKAEHLGDPELVRTFLAGYRTSRYAGVARHWLATHGPQSTDLQYASYTTGVRKMLGGFQSAFASFPKSKPTALANKQLTATNGFRWNSRDFDVVRLVSSNDSGRLFEARANDGTTIEIKGQEAGTDPSKVPEFWSGEGVTGISCAADQIEAGQCAAVELLASFAKANTPKTIGTLFVATVFNPVGSSDSVSVTYDRTLALALRLQVLGLPSASIGFRTFFGSDVPTARDSILLKRGDSKPLPMEILNAVQ